MASPQASDGVPHSLLAGAWSKGGKVFRQRGFAVQGFDGQVPDTAAAPLAFLAQPLVVGLHLPEGGEHGGIVVLAGLHTALLSAVPRLKKKAGLRGKPACACGIWQENKKCHLPTGQMTLCYEDTVFSFRQTPKLRGLL